MNATFLTDFSLHDLLTIILGFVGIILLFWRSVSAGKQAKAAQTQIELATNQLLTGQQDSLDGRYQRIADMLGSDTVSTRVGGIYSLKQLMVNHPEQYHLAGIELLCAFIRSPPTHKSPDADNGSLREDVQAAMSVIGSRAQKALKWETPSSFAIDLEGVNLAGLKLRDANLSWAKLRGVSLANADLMNVNLQRATLDKADFTSACISNTDFTHAFLQGALCDRVSFTTCNFHNSFINGAKITNAYLYALNFERANTYRTDFSGSQFKPTHIMKGNEDGSVKEWDDHCQITQRQLDIAMADPENVPIFDDGMRDPDTDNPLEWNKERSGRWWLEVVRLQRYSDSCPPD